jgi:hypothetical protein
MHEDAMEIMLENKAVADDLQCTLNMYRRNPDSVWMNNWPGKDGEGNVPAETAESYNRRREFGEMPAMNSPEITEHHIED